MTGPTASESAPDVRWFLTFLIALLVFNTAAGYLRKLGLGRLPGDFTFMIRGKPFYVPLASSLLLSFIAMGVGLLI